MRTPQSAVALVLSVGVIVMLLTGSSLRCLWSPCDIPVQPEAVGAWKEVALVILGALSGYISKRDRGEAADEKRGRDD